MIITAEAAKFEFERHVVSQDPDVLDQSRDSSLSIVVWKRRLPRSLDYALGKWAAQGPPRLDGHFSDDSWIDQALCGFSESPARSFIAHDLTSLCATFRRLSGAPDLKLAFGVVSGDQCRKFHADYQRLRLITTYLGPGTEWVPELAVERQAMLEPSICPATANRLIVRDPSLVRHAGAGDVLLLRGHAGVSGEALAAVHRSPPIEAAGAVRVVFVATCDS